MNGYSLLFTAVAILSVAIISGAIVSSLFGFRQLAARPMRHWRRTAHAHRGPRFVHGKP